MSITCGEGQQNGAAVSSPLRLLLRGRLRRFILPVYLLLLRVLFIAPRSVLQCLVGRVHANLSSIELNNKN
jgi:hypothetical protein